MKKRLTVAMFGQKRLTREGGVEIVVKELCTRMAQRGYQITCYNRSGHHVSGAEFDSNEKTEYPGIRQKSVLTILQGMERREDENNITYHGSRNRQPLRNRN